ncbi:uncharacterized protein LOC131530060 isoform X2 [Onychostoma macrolepis]|uniref:uncharacterized protein LOC131530060 isoform X2 n=1 Tax=Onychostoma macrolepis TaxID=369639 RepID=UPI00272B0850|nr:uncharacterized protein LOC131530060 isoform X2 [Onychostoma macrolepis]
MSGDQGKDSPSEMSLTEEHGDILESESVKSDQSKGDVPGFSVETPSSPAKSEISGSDVFSSVSIKSDQSKGDGPDLTEKKPSSAKSERSDLDVFSSVSLKSDQSKGGVPNLSEKETSTTKSVRSGSDVFSSVSVKSDQSNGDRPNLSEKKTSTTKSNKGQKTTVDIGAEFRRWETLKAQMKMKSDVELATFLLNRIQYEKSGFQNNRFKKNFRENLVWIFQDLEYKIIAFLRTELKKFKKMLKKENTQYFVQDFTEDTCSVKEAALDITLYFLKNMKQDELADTLKDELVFIHQRQLKSNLKKKYQCVFEGIAKHGDSTLLNNIYTDLYITQGCSEQVNTEHEVRQIENVRRRAESQEIQVECTNLFKSPEQDKQIRTVLTKGVAGIGKSVSVQKFILDWAEGKENEDITFIFPLPFREMNLKEEKKLSLTSLVSQFFPETKGLNLARKDKFKVLFILDGLDECRLPLNFKGNEMWSDVSSPASLDVLLTNLIKGNLLLSAQIWITTRPAAASKIPLDCIDRLTEIRGFNDAQKEKYFRKRFKDENQAKEIIDHVKKSKSLFIMCHIPVFCWISATVLQNILEEKRNNDLKNNQADDASKTLQESNTEDTPKTLTQMYTHFLRFQILQSRQKYDGEYRPDVSWDKDAILSLGKLAFHQLERNNLIFYESDLEACGISVYKASVYSGMCTQIFKEETGIILGTMYCFVHMSIQEFIAALYAHLFLDINKKNAFVQESTEQENQNDTMIDLLKTAVDKALESDNGHLDLFLRFLLGLSLESKKTLLRGLLTQQDDNDQSKKEVVQYIKQKFEDNLSPDRSINLFYCLNELNDQTLVKEIQTHLREGSLSSSDLSPAQWSALAFVLLTSEEEMKKFELQKFKKSDECLIRLSSVIKTCTEALLNDCNLTDRSCSALATVLGSDSNLKKLNMNNNNLKDSGLIYLCTGLKSVKCELEKLELNKCDLTEESCSALTSVLSSDSSSLKDLDLSNNNLQDSGVKLISDGLKEKCKLEKLRLSNCSITEEGYTSLASALRSNPSHLIELDLTGNDPGQSGVKQLNDLLQDPNCQLKTVRFLGAAAVEACQYVTRIVGKNPLLLRELNLSEHELGDTREITALLQDKHCKLNTLILNNISITEEGCAALTSAFNSNPSNLIELDLSGNEIGNSGVKKICPLLENTLCRLEKLKLSDCSITEEGYKTLTSSLKSNSHLTELDLKGNDPGQSGVEGLIDLLQDNSCKLKTIRFLKCPAAQEACEYLTEALGASPLLLTELDLSEDKLGDLDGEKLSALLMDSHSKLEKMKLNNCELTEKNCSVLATVLSSKTILKEMNLNKSRLLDSGIKKICEGLKNPVCELKILNLSDCSITEEGYKALASALRSNPSHLIELNLTGNDPGQSGVKQLSDLLQDPNCQLKTLRLLQSPDAEEACKYLTEILPIKNLLLLRELNLSERELGDKGVNQIAALLQDKHCKLNTLILRKCGLKEESCSALATVLRSNSSLKELDMSNNNLQDSGVKKLQNGLENTNCTLQKLSLSDCSVTEEGYKALASALRSNPSHLIELDLTGNDPGQSGVKQLDDLLQDPNCQLKSLRFLNPAADEACQHVNRVLGENLLLLRELNLSECKLGDSGFKKLSMVLQDKHCKLNTLILNNSDITEEDCHVLAAALNLNPSNLTELNLSGTKLRNSGIKIFLTLFKNEQCSLRKLIFNCIYITAEGCAALTSEFNSNPSNLTELDLSGNKLGNSGVTEISTLLGNSQCTLQILRLSDCSITEEGYKALASALRSNPSHLIELDLTGNDPGQSGVKQLSDLLQDPNCQLKTLRFLGPAADEACQYVSGIVGKNLLLLRELNLSGRKLGDTRVNQITALLQDKHCKLNTLMLSNNSITAEGCAALTSAFNSNPSNLIELDLSGNKLQNSGIEKIFPLLKNTKCKLEKLKLSDCNITEEGYKALASALRSNPSHLIELDLTGNDPGPSGVKKLSDLLQDRCCKLKTIRFLKSPAAEEACEYLTEVLGKSPLLLKELDLSEDKLGDLDWEKLSALLMDSHSKLEKIKLNNCKLTEKSCSVLATVLSSKTILKEMNLNNSRLLDSGVKEICVGLKNPVCELKILKLSKCDLNEESCSALASVLSSDSSSLKDIDLTNNNLQDSGVKLLSDGLKENRKLEKLSLSDCSITEEGYKALASALRSNPSHLIELDLTGNDPGQSGVKELNDLLQDPNCQLKTLRFLGPAADEACQYVTGIVGENPLLLRELNLNGRELGDTRVNQIAALLQDKHCKLNNLTLSNNSITAEGCAALTSAFNSNPSNLTELDLSGNKLQKTGIEKICPLLENAQCRLEKLKLSDCSITEEGYTTLTSSLKSNSHLTELDLRGNYPGQSGVEGLIDLQRAGCCKLKTFRFLKSPAAQEACECLTEVLGVNPLVLKELDLSEDKLGDLDGEKLSALLMDSHSKLEKMTLNNCELTEKSSILATVLSSKTILKEMNLNNSRLLDSGVKEICEGLKNPVCELKILKLSDCSITEEGYKALASALRSNPSHLIELDLTGNDPGQSGVKQLIDVQKDPNCQLKTLRFLSPAADETCQYVTGIVGKNLLLLRELNLSERELGDTNMKRLAVLLQDKHCQLSTLILRKCGLTGESCSALATVLRSNSSLKELDTSNNNLQDSGVKKLQNGLENTNCTLKKLRLSDCSITEEGYNALASALRSNPSHLIELDLTGNDPGQSGVKQLDDLLQDPNCQLKTLRLLGPAADEACQYVNRVLGENLLLLRELNLSERELGLLGLKRVTMVLQDKHCKLNTLILNNSDITEEDCRLLAAALNSNPSNLIELNLSGTKLKNSGMKIFSTLFKNEQCRLKKLKFNSIFITAEDCAALTSAFNSNPSNLIELDLSGNKLGNSGVTEISTLLGNSQCTLQILRLSNCSITEEGYKALASALRSNPSHLIELDLTGNDPGQSGVKQLSDLLQDQNYNLKLRFLGPAADEACQYVAGIVGKNPLLLRELNLSEHELGDTRVNQIAALLQDKHCKLNTLKLSNNSITAEGCAALTSAFNSNPSNLIELDLSGNKLENSGIKKICLLVENKECRLQKLELSDCSITEEGYKALASALRSNPSHLIELDLTGNDPGQSGVKQLSDLLQDGQYKLNTIRFLKSPAAEEACKYLTKVLQISPLLLTELDLSEDKLGDLDGEKLSALLMDSHSKLETMKLNNCELTKKSCSVLATVLSSKTTLKELNLNNSRLLDSGVKEICEGLKNPVCELKILKLSQCDLTDESCSALASVLSSDSSSLRDLDLSNNNLQDSGVKLLSDGLKENCKLEKLSLSNCSITEEGYKALASALRSNPSHLIELDLTGNDPGQSGVKQLNDLLQDPNCQLKTLRFLGPAADEACRFVTGIVGKNPLLLRELNLSGRELGDTRVNQIAILLQDKHCKLNTLMLNNNSITEKGFAALTSVFMSNLANLIELDLSGNKLGKTGIEKICSLLRNPQCILKKLKLSDCSITEEGYTTLTSSLKSNSHLIELDLTGNYPGRSGVQDLIDLLRGGCCKLKTVRFLKSSAAQEACDYLSQVLGTNPLVLTELDLSEDKLGDLDGEKLSALLMDSHSKLEKLKLNNCELTEKSCSVLATVLSSKTILKEMNLNNSCLLDSGVREICEGLKKSKLKILKLSNCCITEEGYKALALALKSNSNLIELDLTGNDPGESGVEQLSDSQKGRWFSSKTLKTLRFLGPVADEACQYVTGIVGKNPLLLRELNLSKHELGDTGVNQIAALLQDKHCKLKALQLRDCGLTEESCSALATVLRSNPSLKELDMSNNNLQDAGVKKLQNGLENTNCTLQKLRLSDCSITEEGYKALASALRSNPSHLIELDLTGNDPGQSGVKQLNDLLQDPNYQLKTLRFLGPAADEACQYVTGIVGKNPLLLRELNLSLHELGDTRVNQIAALLQDKHCKLNTLTLRGCSITEKQCLILTSALCSNLSHLRELNLSGNKIENKGVKHVSETLKDVRCKLEILRLRHCYITDAGCSALTSALKSNPSHLRELDLSGNELGDAGFENLSDLLMNLQCKLEILALCECRIKEKQCVFLTSALKSNPSHLRELDLSGNELKHSRVTKFNDILKDSFCKLEKLRLRSCGIKADDCSALTSALKSNPSHLRELDLSGNEMGQSRVENLSDLLMNPQCKLEKLALCRCSITEKQCLILTSALKSNPSHLRELDLSENKLGDSGVENLGVLLSSSQCKLKKLHLCRCSITEKQCIILTPALCLNPSHLRELNLSGNKIENKGVQILCDVLINTRCKLERLSLNDCGITDVAALAQSLAEKNALQFLKELDLSNNKIGDSKKQLSDVLRDSNCNLR